MKAPLILTILAGIYLSGMTGLLRSFDLGLPVNHTAVMENGASDHKNVSSHQEKALSRGSEAAAASEEQGQMALAERSSQPEPETQMIREFFKPLGSVYTFLKVQGVEGEKVTIEVFDISGKLVLSREGIMDSAESEFMLNFTHAMDGVYIVRATAGEKQTSMKYVKQTVG